MAKKQDGSKKQQTKKAQNPKPRTSKQTSAKAHKPKPSFIARHKGLVAVLIVVAALYGVQLSHDINKTTALQKSMEAYLEDKYNKDFVVGRPRLEGAGLGIDGEYRATAHPEGDTSLIFNVGRAQKEEVFSDGYTGKVWEREERPRVESFLRGLYGTQISEFSLSTNISMKRNEPNPIRGTVPSIDAAIQEYADNFFYSLSVNILSAPLSDSDKIGYQEKFKSVAEYVKGRGAKLHSLRFAINLTDNSGSYVCDAGYYNPETDIDTTASTCFNNKRSGKAW